MQPIRPSSIAFDRLPRIPASIARALRHVRDPEVTPEGIGRLLAVEEDVLALLARAAAQPPFGISPAAPSLPAAIARMGRQAFQELLFAVGALSLFKEGSVALDAGCLRSHALACGLVARDLARRLRVGEPDVAFRAGLVHDIGLLAAGAGLRKASFRATARAAESGRLLTRIEAVMMGPDHCHLGRLYGERLDLEPAVLEAIRYHHEPAEAPEPRAVPALVALSDHICRAAGIGYGFPEDLDGALGKHPGWRVLCEAEGRLEGIDPSKVAEELLRSLPDVREAVVHLWEEPVPA